MRAPRARCTVSGQGSVSAGSATTASSSASSRCSSRSRSRRDVFLTWANLTNILDQWAPVGIMACAATLVIIAGGFDLSVGAIFAVAGIVAAKLAQHDARPRLGSSPRWAWVWRSASANGLLTTVGRINSFVGTLASSFMIRGFALVLSGGFLVTVRRPQLPDARFG